MKIKIETKDGGKVYWVNDVQYNRLEDIPAEFQQYFTDTDNNGMPDQFDDILQTVKKFDKSGMFEKFESSFSNKPNTGSKISPPKPMGHYSPVKKSKPLIPMSIKVAIVVLICLMVYFAYKKLQKPESYKDSTLIR